MSNSSQTQGTGLANICDETELTSNLGIADDPDGAPRGETAPDTKCRA